LANNLIVLKLAIMIGSTDTTWMIRCFFRQNLFEN